MTTVNRSHTNVMAGADTLPTPEARMAAFDKLPRCCREFLRDACSDFEPRVVGRQYRRLRREGHSVEAVMAMFRDRDEVLRHRLQAETLGVMGE